jgi:Raf kinase inhibitor-like YbhB/YbcL family protein
MKLTSPAFEQNTLIPKKYTCEGENINPALLVTDIPKNAASLALIMDDPDAPAGTFVHWVVYDMPLAEKIDENSVPGVQGVNGRGADRYAGPCPPSGKHRYYFRLYALDKVLALRKGANRNELERAMKNHVLDKSELMGLYQKER